MRVFFFGEKCRTSSAASFYLLILHKSLAEWRCCSLHHVTDGAGFPGLGYFSSTKMTLITRVLKTRFRSFAMLIDSVEAIAGTKANQAANKEKINSCSAHTQRPITDRICVTRQIWVERNEEKKVIPMERVWYIYAAPLHARILYFSRLHLSYWNKSNSSSFKAWSSGPFLRWMISLIRTTCSF